MTALLEGLRIVDLTHHIAGPYSTKFLAEYGADVIKVERPGTGDPTRHTAPFAGDDPHLEKSGLFLNINTSKRGITLNLKSETGIEILKRLVSTADAVIESFRPGTMERLRIGYDTLSKLNPGLVMTSISNFGQTGPYRDYRASEITEYAMGGAMFGTGYPGREPIKLGGTVVQHEAGQIAALATAISLFGAEARGEGEHLDISIMETQMQSQDRRATMLIAYQFCGRINGRGRRPGSLGGGVRPCADGYVNVNAQAHWFPIVMEMIGHPELVQDPRFSSDSARARPEAPDELEEYTMPWYMGHTMQEIWVEAQRHRLLSGPVYSPKDVFNDDFFRKRGYWETISHPVAGTFTYPGRSFRVHTMGSEPRKPAPTLGQHNEEVLCGELGYSAQDLLALETAGVI